MNLTQEEERNIMISSISDLFKERNGFRPRATDWTSMDIEDLKNYESDLRDQLNPNFYKTNKSPKTTMKQSDLKEYIKEEIISVLSEDTKEDIEDTKELTAATKELADAKKDLVNEYENIGLADIEEMGYEVGEDLFSQIRDKFQNTPDFKAYFSGIKQGFLDNLGSYSLNEDIDDEEEADKAASKGAKKEPLGKLSKKLGETQKEMKSVLVKFKKAEGAEKDKHLKRLKELTKIKKELEKSL